jgi:hypothetical protein
VTSVAADPSTAAVNSRLVGSMFTSQFKNTNEIVPGLFVGDISNHVVWHFTVDGFAQVSVGNGTRGDDGDDDLARNAHLIAPSGLAEAKDGTLYVADSEANRIRVVVCGDADRCKGDVSYNGSTCVWGMPPSTVNDGNACTDDTCFWTVGTPHNAYGSNQSCSDGNPCNGSETCNGTTCVAGSPLGPGASCSDGNVCNGNETCNSAQVCVPGYLLVTDDWNQCTADSCSPSGGISHSNIQGGPCVTNDPCQNPGTCQNGVCNTTAVILNDPINPCVTETCDPSTGIRRTFNTGVCPGGTCSAGTCVPSGGFSATTAIDNTVPPSSAAVFAAIYDPTNGVQTGATIGTAPGELNPDHAAHLFGTVAMSDAALPLNVKVVVLNHPESGQTLVRGDGKYDIVANGGGPIVLRFTKTGYLPVDRRAAPVWGAGAHIDDVTMVKLDAKSTGVAINSGSFQDSSGTTTTAAMDARGQRTARVVFPPNITATAVSSSGDGGTSTTLGTSITVRATEFTVGNSAEAFARMPAPLPGASLYTYAVDFSVDEAPSAASVVFNQPVFAYLKNFLGLPAGENISDGFMIETRRLGFPRTMAR